MDGSAAASSRPLSFSEQNTAHFLVFDFDGGWDKYLKLICDTLTKVIALALNLREGSPRIATMGVFILTDRVECVFSFQYLKTSLRTLTSALSALVSRKEFARCGDDSLGSLLSDLAAYVGAQYKDYYKSRPACPLHLAIFSTRSDRLLERIETLRLEPATEDSDIRCHVREVLLPFADTPGADMRLDNGGGLEDDALAITWFIRAALVLVVAGLCLKAYVLYSKRVYRGTTTMSGKTVIVTGGNAGIGKETAKELARRKARVILACRNMQRAQKAARDIFAETGEAVVVKQLDLCSFKSVRAFAEDVVRTEPRLDVLINNAGNIPDKLMLTEDGYEVGLQSNYLGHFLLTILLTELLKKSAPSRVVNLSSVLHHFGTTWRIEEQAKGTYGWRTPLLTYCNTKMAMVLFTRALAPRLKIHGVTANAVHPGAVDTGIAGEERLIAYLFRILVNFYGRTAWEGAQTSLYAAVDDRFATDTGLYLEECARGIVSYRAVNRKCVENTFARTISLCHLDPTEVEKLFELPGGRAA
ncbi:retinol dehydrogenase 12-like isoform X3 [Dermacentor albipictus]|uniref:retinol dehydrogenase 12-like isoform X3 n=1 Tax=Dermacentor albipictus TaxID=60249 RepID=UPI0031FE04E3